MSKIEKEFKCVGCSSEYEIVYNSDVVNYNPEICPFCGEPMDIEGYSLDEDLGLDEDDDDLFDKDEEDKW